LTHDELLAKLWILPADVTESQHGAKAVHALRAVVELHKPESMIVSSYCVACTINLETVSYPCPTIQAIEKELG
jgi:hypothetical protein